LAGTLTGKMMVSLVQLLYGLDYKDYVILLKLKIFVTVLNHEKLMGNDVLIGGEPITLATMGKR
jgi:hypothetical protein